MSPFAAGDPCCAEAELCAAGPDAEGRAASGPAGAVHELIATIIAAAKKQRPLLEKDIPTSK
jgi:hypothetical protein